MALLIGMNIQRLRRKVLLPALPTLVLETAVDRHRIVFEPSASLHLEVEAEVEVVAKASREVQPQAKSGFLAVAVRVARNRQPPRPKKMDRSPSAKYRE